MSVRKKVLIVEDDQHLLELYRTKLELSGLEVLSAPNGEAGYAVAAKERPQLVLLDIMMPREDGFALLKKMKRDKLTQPIPVIIFSNLSQKEEIERGFRLGAHDYIIKTSLTPSQLSERVVQFLQSSS